jgi:hypothetical protein
MRWDIKEGAQLLQVLTDRHPDCVDRLKLLPGSGITIYPSLELRGKSTRPSVVSTREVSGVLAIPEGNHSCIIGVCFETNGAS